ncbi:SusC/RagA family TonB-linked outer membrane protein [Flavisolibacter ginsenosidimutans]|uniref:SusC/RagA family TonB-linked outer membrane protein n=1 Tax=Flavisolibacter ginsenosidimutans TaxID=661481 RepID=A0A5B8UGB5_9BACT|nr:SusC/RagA family TonB-linked outer membrane protein [Flavisolibacter ginsenosidimutans]QEC55548.1 SusC/RagA family TonB-linked outer membrane protein [Flavisolibacter ginsenosidimutans]
MRRQLDYLVRNKAHILLLLLFAAPFYAWTQSKEIKGIVKDDKGAGIAGATITVKGKGRSKASEASGTFSIQAAEGETLVFSAVGYSTVEVPVTRENDYTVSMSTASNTLSDVVIVGYGSSSRRTLTTSVTTVKPEELNRGAIADVGQLLQGKVPGLNITASGDPNRSAAVILRGASTINSPGGPYYVIDGVPGADIATIAPDDVASIDVLKDAAATAIYGNRAANGVIIVTTKRGRKGQTQISYNGYVGVESVSGQLKMMDASQLRSFLAKNNLSFTPADDKGANTDWQKAVERDNALSTNHNLSFSGGSEHGTYSASVNYIQKQGILKGSDLERFIGRLSMEQYALNDRVKFGLTVTNSTSNANDIAYRNTVLLQSALYLPVSPIMNADGTYFENLTKQNYYNPVAMMKNSQANNKYSTTIGNFTTQVKLPWGLSYDLSLSYQRYNYLNSSYLDKYFTSNYNNMYDNPDPTTYGHGLQSFGTNGQAYRGAYQSTQNILETFFTWQRKFGAHSINAVLGYSWQQNINNDGVQASSTNFTVDNTGYLNFALSNPYAIPSFRINLGGGAYQKIRSISDFARLNYNFKEKYLLQASIRRDGGSVFGANKQWGYFPAAAVAWRMSQEDFMRNQTIFNDLKLRASYGVTGNSLGFDPLTAKFSSGSLGTFYYNGVLTAAYGPVHAANPDLEWEKITTTNIGFDFTLLKGKLNGTLDWYNKNTTNMIYNYKVDPMLVPVGNITANGGSINNKGIELSLNYSPVSTKNFMWTTRVNLAHNVNKITSLSNPSFIGGDSVAVAFPEGAGQSGSSLELLKVGHPVGQFFTFQYAGKNSAGVSQYVAADGKTLTTTPIRGTDYHYLGDAQPKLLLGWNNTFRYKTFDLNIFIRGVFGNKIFNATKADLFRPNTAQYTNILVSAGDESTADYNAYRYSDRFIESGSYVRFDNATLGYSFKQFNQYIKSFRVYASVNNLFVITKFTGVDPEVNQGGIAPGVDYNNFYPKTRTVLLGVNVSF